MAEFGCTLNVEGPNGEQVELIAVDVEGQFVGLGLTERQGLNMRRVGAELRDLEQVRKLRDCLTAFLERTNSNGIDYGV